MTEIIMQCFARVNREGYLPVLDGSSMLKGSGR